MEISSIFFVAPSQADSAPRLEQHGESNGRSYSPLFKAAGLIAVATVVMVIVFTLLPALIAVALAILTSIGIMHNIFTDCCCCCEDNSSSTPSRPSYRTDTAGVPIVRRGADQTPRTPERQPTHRQEEERGIGSTCFSSDNCPKTAFRSGPPSREVTDSDDSGPARRCDLFGTDEPHQPFSGGPLGHRRAGDSTGFGANTPGDSQSPRRAGNTTGFGEEK